MIGKHVLLAVFFLCAQLLSAQGEGYEVEPPLTVLPFPVSDGWTFVGDSSNTNTYPVYDSIVFYEWEFFIARPQIAINKEGFYGLLSAAEQVDTLEAFEYDSLFYFGANYFGRKNGTWTNWQLQWNFPKWDLKTKPFGKVERWFRDEMGLYFWQNGKMGVFNGYFGNDLPAEYKYCHYFGQLEVKITENEYTVNVYYLVSDGKHFGLLENDKPIIPVVASNIQFWEHGFIRYWQNGWKYLRVSDHKLIDPDGADVVIYNPISWKIFNSDRTRSTLYLFNGSRVLSGNYQDYFMLENKQIVARKDSSTVVLLNSSGQLVFDCGCEQLDYLEDDRFSCLKKGKWVLVDDHGQQLSKQGFDHINRLNGSTNRLRVHENNRIGVIDLEGKLIYPVSYSAVFTNGTIYLLENDRGFAVGTANGDFLSEHLYQDHYYSMQNPNLVVMYNSWNNLDLYSPKTKLNSRPVNLFLYADEVVKCYEKEGLELVVLESNLSVSERIFYPGMSSMEVGEMPKEPHYVYDTKAYNRSHLEEHQLSGYFGYRFNWNTDHINPPHFKEVQQNLAFGLDFCVETYENEPFSINENLTLTSQNHYQIVSEAGGTYQWEPMISSTLPMESAGGSSSDNRLNYYGNGRQDWVSGLSKHSHDANQVVYIHYDADDLYTYNVGGKVVPAKDLRNSFSVFDYMQRFNLRGNLMMTNETIDYVMDPSNRLKVEGGSWFVDIDYTTREEKISDNLKGKLYESISYYNSWEPDLSTYLAKTGSKYIWSFQGKDSVLLDRFKAIETTGSENDYYIVTSADAEQAKVHPYNPQYVFIENDSTLFYQNGRILRHSITGWGLNSIDGEELIPPIQDEIRYLNNDLFALRNEEEWKIITRDGVLSNDLVFTEVQPYENDFAIARMKGSSVLIDRDVNVVFQSNEGAIKAAGSGFYTVESIGKMIVFKPDNQLRDTILSAEKHLQNGWVYGRMKEKRYLRKLGSKERIFVKSTAMPEVIGDLILIDKNGLYTVMKTDGTLVFSKNKKWKSVEKGDGMIVLKSDKEWCFLNLSGTQIHTCKKGKSLNYFDQRFVIEQQDTTYGLDQFGNFYVVTKEGMKRMEDQGKSASTTPSGYKIVESVNGYGVMDDRGNMLVTPIHLAVLGKQGEEFIVETLSKKGVYNRSLQPLIPVQFDQITGYDARFFLVRQGSKHGICTASGEWFCPIH
ncbi:MAG: hypothetical protein A3D31_18170 [Candidatus Fluviicola riflensis]|nr:MAG: hypothetical protein CHH17_03110 [Candidatus Fluviicola riflensis]OGS76908.1 MAG: hypothetical protein A3D31_18170 [Candidatus Fluviicola riflensis]OGS81837.1 MAG: hypothetical protein A2724_15570 [Fluviicola sp. RIFCSPHIGHO2_01_FULL_43_53]OGS88637.1 MAG: hypothetical protein A3E30_07680 [Fluviicola sp. RIFCSPHIGHO2_12_FULL_43_24]